MGGAGDWRTRVSCKISPGIQEITQHFPNKDRSYPDQPGTHEDRCCVARWRSPHQLSLDDSAEVSEGFTIALRVDGAVRVLERNE